MLFNNDVEWQAWLKRQKDDGTCISFVSNKPEKYPCWAVDWRYDEQWSRWMAVFVYDGEMLNKG